MKHCRPHALAVLALIIVAWSGWLHALSYSLLDLRFSLQSRPATGKIAVVAIDAASIEKIGVWPWSRSLYAKLLSQLQVADVQEIALDVDFSSSSDPAADADFAQALKSAGGSVILPSFQQPGTDRASIHVNQPLPQFARHAWAALVNVEVGPDGLVRRYPFGGQIEKSYVPSMASILVGLFVKDQPSFFIDFGIRSASIPRVSFIDVLDGKPEALQQLAGKKVIVGGTALELGDRFSVPNGGILSGPVLQALSAESIVQGRVLRWTSGTIALMLAGLLVVTMALTWRSISAGKRLIALIAISASAEIAAHLLQLFYPVILDTSLFHAAVLIYIFVTALDEIDVKDWLGRIAESRFQRVAMSLGDGLVCANQNHIVTVWNPGAAKIFGYRADEIIGRSFGLICASNDTREFSIDRLQSFAAGTVLEFDGRRKNGETFPVEASFSAWQGADGVQFGAILRDISVRKREAARIRYLAEFDILTGLINRNTFHDRLTDIAKCAASRGVTLLILGLDRFQEINEVFGHAVGDLVLRVAAERLKERVNGAFALARLGGDEFAIALATADLSESVEEFAARFIEAFTKPLIVGNREHRLAITIGAAVYPTAGESADEILSNGHLALSRAKATSRGGILVFQESMRKGLESRLKLEAELIEAAEKNQFTLFYQPQFDLAHNQLIGAEALIRWHHPTRGLVPPGEFMPVVNRSPVSDRIAEWVLSTACAQAAKWERAGHKLRIGVNLSPSQFRAGDLVGSVSRELERSGVSPDSLELEVTEDILLKDENSALTVFQGIQELGVRLVFDDFGTGFASLSYLQKFPLDGLKIDRSFVQGMVTNAEDAVIVQSTISLAKQLGLSVIAEGIEDSATAELVLRMGCTEGQGYLFGKPMPPEDFERHFLPATALSVAS